MLSEYSVTLSADAKKVTDELEVIKESKVRVRLPCNVFLPCGFTIDIFVVSLYSCGL